MGFMRSGNQIARMNCLHGRFFCIRAAGQRAVFLGLLMAIAFLTICAQTGKAEPMEPSYQGRSLSSWLGDFNNPTSPAQEAEAAEAVGHIGSPALPFLIDRLSESNHLAYLKALKQWQETQLNSPHPGARPSNPRWEAFSGLDALGVRAMTALPDLQKLLDESPPDPAVLYLAVRTGPPGIFLLNKYLTNNIPVLSLEAKVLSDMLAANSEELFPGNSESPETSSFRRRMSELNSKLKSAALLEYSKTHPQIGSPAKPGTLQPPAGTVRSP